MKLIKTEETVIGSNEPRNPPKYILQINDSEGFCETSVRLSTSELEQLQKLINLALPPASTNRAAISLEDTFAYANKKALSGQLGGHW